MKLGIVGFTLCILLCGGGSVLNAQTVSGEISGVVADQGGAVVVGATVDLISDLDKQTREFKTDNSGEFLFTGVVPGGYGVRVTQAGFKTYEQKGILLSAQERLSLHELKLEIGDVNTSVEVTAETTHVATDSSDHTININKQEIEDAPAAGRNYLSLLRVLPGTAFTTTTDTRGSPTPKSNAGSGVDGTVGQMLMTLDGVAQQDNGNPRTGGFLAPSVDAIQEVQVLVSNYSAQYGSRSGGQLNVTIKNGTNQFHGSVYWYMRHEMFNANEWFNNKNVNSAGVGVPKPRYRYQNPGLTFGGPLLIPGTRFNRGRNKSFFFFSEDYLHNINSPTTPSTYTMPTQLERSGNFSQTVTSTGLLIPIHNPNANGIPFSGNIIPPSLINPIGAAMMNLFPLPFTTDPTGQRAYNTLYTFPSHNPREDRILRVDYNLNQKTTLYVRLIQDYQDEQAMTGLYHLTGGWGQGYTDYGAPSAGAVVNLIHTFRSNLIEEFTAGVNHFHEQLSPTDPATFAAENELPLKDASGNALPLPSAFPGANVLNLRPQISFGTSGAQSAGQAVTGTAPTFGFDGRWPFFGNDGLINITNNATWIKGHHNTKFGFYFERGSRDTANSGTGASAEGQYFFGSDTANPLDTGYAFSNMLNGTVQAYSQDNQKQVNHGRYKQFEWFAQDTWKVSHRVTIDLGIRFQVLGPVTSNGAILSAFSQEAYSQSKSGQLLYPACTTTVSATGSCPAANLVAINPATKATYPYNRAGLLDPASYAVGTSPYSGMVSYNSHYWKNPGLAYSPRVGFAWDVFGDGKMAVRGGFGIFYDRAFASGVETQGFLLNVPPAFQSPVFYNTTFSGLSSATGFLGPQTAYGGGQNYLNPTVYNFSLGIQRNLGKGTILDVSFVGNALHHGFGGGGAGSNGPVDGNPVAPYTDWLPVPNANTTAQGQVKAYLDPTSKNGGTATFYTANLIRALAGGYQPYGSINLFNNNGESHYDSLQVQVNKRLGRLQVNSNWTWAKQITYSHSQFLPDELTRNVAGRPQAVNATFGYFLPNGSSVVGKSALTTALLDGWHLSGVTAFFMGTPLTIGCAATGAPIGWPTGTPADAPAIRCQMNGNLWLPSGTTPASVGSTTDPRLWYPFAASNFTLPSMTSLGVGNTPLTLTYGPGFENFDLAMYKDFRLGKETRVLEFRADTFNTFNHFNPGNPNTSLTFPYANYVIGANTNASFGAITTAQNTARHMALSLRLRF
jgi:hypothetical protein